MLPVHELKMFLSVIKEDSKASRWMGPLRFSIEENNIILKKGG